MSGDLFVRGDDVAPEVRRNDGPGVPITRESFAAIREELRSVCETRRMANVLRGAGWVDMPNGWRPAGTLAAPLPLAEAYAELRRQMRETP